MRIFRRNHRGTPEPTVSYDRAREIARAAAPARYYGDGTTIHHTGKVNVELDEDGVVVAVWYRCMMLPFDQTIVSDSRARDMRSCKVEASLDGVIVTDRS
jgi:hypothetical protein